MSVDTYWKEIRDNENINKEKQKTASIEQLVVSNLKLVVKIAHQYKNMGVDLEDLIQEGNVGLMEAAEKFDRNAKNKFNTYAVHYIKMKMRNSLNKNRSMVKQSSSQINTTNKIQKYIKLYKSKHDIEPTIKEISEKLELSETIVKNAIFHKVNGSLSLNQKIKDDGEDTFEKILNLENCVLSPADQMVREDDGDHIRSILTKLSERERQVINERFFDDRTLQQIGDSMGLSPAGVKAIQDRSLKKLKAIL